MIYEDEITQRLEELMNLHPEFRKLYMNDPTVHAWLKIAMTFDNREYLGSAEEMLVGIIVALGRDKQAEFNNHLDHMKLCMSPLTVKVKA